MAEGNAVPGIDAFVAIGDSFTEGLNDPGADGGFRGWADRVAVALAAHRPGFRYANLAIRGKLLGQIVADQVPRAIELAPDLISLAAGGGAHPAAAWPTYGRDVARGGVAAGVAVPGPLTVSWRVHLDLSLIHI